DALMAPRGGIEANGAELREGTVRARRAFREADVDVDEVFRGVGEHGLDRAIEAARRPREISQEDPGRDLRVRVRETDVREISPPRGLRLRPAQHRRVRGGDPERRAPPGGPQGGVEERDGRAERVDLDEIVRAVVREVRVKVAEEALCVPDSVLL